MAENWEGDENHEIDEKFRQFRDFRLFHRLTISVQLLV